MSQRCNTVTYTATADTVHVDVHVTRILRQNIHVYCVHVTVLLITAFQGGQREWVKCSKQLGFLYFTYSNMCLNLTVFCSTGHKIALNIQRFQETGTKLDILKLSTPRVSWGNILQKQRHDVTWTM